MATTYEEKTLVCRDCTTEFSWSAGEQEFFAQKGFDKPPTRCPECRKKRRNEKQGTVSTSVKPLFDIICANCGKTGQVPFEPKSASILCADCFRSRTNPVSGGSVASPAAPTQTDDTTAVSIPPVPSGSPSVDESSPPIRRVPQ